MEGGGGGEEGFLQQLLHQPGKATVEQPRLAISFALEDGVAQKENVSSAASTAGTGDGRKDKVCRAALISSLITGRGSERGPADG